jgi:DeoR/GlpR family transcriptional regulator of sugar metabolism
MGTTNKDQIFNYIKKTPDIRTKEVMTEFSALSGRTVKRNLKELIDEGFLKKKSDGVAVYYTCG